MELIDIVKNYLEQHERGVEIKELGTIELRDRVMVSDPCYEVGTWCQGIVPIKDGTYRAFVIVTDEGVWGKRNAELIVLREDTEFSNPVMPFEPEPLDFEVGVDSGQAGIFNLPYYEKNQPDDSFDKEGAWYNRICEITLNGDECGTIDNEGVVSASGIGDGGYNCYPAYADEFEEIVGLRIAFIEDYDDDDYEDEDE